MLRTREQGRKQFIKLARSSYIVDIEICPSARDSLTVMVGKSRQLIEGVERGDLALLS
jgi:hypothetical protein